MPGRARQPKIGAPQARTMYKIEFRQELKRQGCEGGHVTRLVRSDKDSVIMVQCIDTVRTHRCAPLPPPWGPKDQ